MTREEATRLMSLTLLIGKLSRELDSTMKSRKVRDDYWEGYHKGMDYAAQIVADEVQEMIEEGEV